MAKFPGFRFFRRAVSRAAADEITKSNPHRREFLKTSAALSLAGMPAANLLLQKNAMAAVKKIAAPAPMGGEPVIVLGGGLSGLTTAYRLMKTGIPCEVYEASDRLGGRIFTKDHFNKDRMFCELGGEFIDSKQYEMLNLAHELGLQTENYLLPDKHLKDHQFFFGGRRYYDEDLTKASAPLARRLLKDMNQVYYNLKDPIVTYHKYKPGAVKFDKMNLAEYLDSMRNEVEKWVIDGIGVAYLGEFGLDLASQSAINLMALVSLDPEDHFPIFGSSDESTRVKGGNSRLIEALEKALAPSVRIHRDRKLVKIAKSGSSALEMTFTSRQGTNVESRKSTQVVCTIPFSVLRGVEGIGKIGISPVKMKAINGLGYGVNAKNFVGYHSRPWRKADGDRAAVSGYTFADTPTQAFWDGSRSQLGQSGIIVNFMGGVAALTPEISKKENVLNDFEKVIPGTKALFDGNYFNFGWCNYPFTLGSYSCPCPGQYTSFMGSAGEPELNGKLLFAGEHVSLDNQGYMNGAVKSANEAAKLVSAHRGRRSFLKLDSLILNS